MLRPKLRMSSFREKDLQLLLLRVRCRTLGNCHTTGATFIPSFPILSDHGLFLTTQFLNPWTELAICSRAIWLSCLFIAHLQDFNFGICLEGLKISFTVQRPNNTLKIKFTQDLISGYYTARGRGLPIPFFP